VKNGGRSSFSTLASSSSLVAPQHLLLLHCCYEVFGQLSITTDERKNE
jgi:hypothetical protein